ncbi:MAG: nucleotide sugar dehydrogenase [Comamonadaceae bacterium]|nr:MAG: nucleotide sugar dehydrogenase [Comamonadaceae bacterium]
MKIAIVGMGYVGVTAAACLSSQGHQVCGIDVNETKVEALRNGRSPITEPGVDELILAAVERGDLTASISMPDLGDFNLVIVCVGTPSSRDGSHNMSFIADASRQIAIAARAPRDSPLTVAYRSTFRPGTMDTLVRGIFEGILGVESRSQIELVYNPEFLRESSAVWDFFNPPKIVIGTEMGKRSTTMMELHADLEAPVFELSFRDSEMTKFVDNTWHAVKVAFANEIGRVCAANDVSASAIHEVFIADTKLNISAYYLRPGGPFGGSCLPKDVRALGHIAHTSDADAPLIDSVLQSNEIHKAFQLERVRSLADPGARVLMLGLSFKSGTDDLRESPHLDLARSLLLAGYEVSVFDPNLDPHVLVGQNLGYAFTHLPEVSSLLVSQAEATGSTWDLVLRCTAVGDDLEWGENPMLALDRIP